VDEEIFLVGIQICYTFGFDDLVVEFRDFFVREGVVERDQATHSLAGVKGKDAEVSSLWHRLVTPWHCQCHDHHHHLPNW
ncbi:hypothetical protein A2U01_0047990, partial [Trifolium medium]|nr:hypothetical protein [Trifolium medium]